MYVVSLHVFSFYRLADECIKYMKQTVPSITWSFFVDPLFCLGLYIGFYIRVNSRIRKKGAKSKRRTEKNQLLRIIMLLPAQLCMWQIPHCLDLCALWLWWSISAWNKYFASAGHRVRQSIFRAGHSQFVPVIRIWYTIEIWKPAGHCDLQKTNCVGHTWNHARQWPMTGG